MSPKEMLQHIIDHNGVCYRIPYQYCDKCPLSDYGTRSCLDFVTGLANVSCAGVHLFAVAAEQMLTDMAITEILLGGDNDSN